MAEITICSDFGAQKNKVYGNLLKLIPYNYTKRGLFFHNWKCLLSKEVLAYIKSFKDVVIINLNEFLKICSYTGASKMVSNKKV